MEYRGHVKAGHVVLDDPAALPEGTPVSGPVRSADGQRLVAHRLHLVHRGVVDALTADHHFAQAGFRVLLK